MDAFEAKRYGLCTRVVPDGEVVMVAFDKAQVWGGFHRLLCSRSTVCHMYCLETLHQKACRCSQHAV